MYTVRSIIRKGMYKNWEMGRVLFTRKCSDKKWELDIEVLEMAFDSEGKEFVAKRMLSLVVKKDRFIDIAKKLVEKEPVLVGYYSQSYRSDNGNAYTINSLRAIERIPTDDMDMIAKSIWANKQDPIQVFESSEEVEKYFNDAIDREDTLS